MEGIILCGGKGTRINLPYNKCLVTFNNKPLIYYNIKLLQKYVKKINIIVKYDHKNVIKTINNYFNDINFILQKGDTIIDALREGIEYINSNEFVLSFGDEFCYNSDLSNMINMYREKNPIGVIGVSFLSTDLSDIKKTFSIYNNGQKVLNVTEKPKYIINNIQGTGHAIFNKRIYKYIDNVYDYPMIIQKAINNNEDIYLSSFCDTYFNINSNIEYISLKKREEVYNE